MPNNFRLAGSVYVSKAGNDANSGTSPDAPKRTIQAGLNLLASVGGNLIIGAGVYTETVNTSTLTINSAIYGDGKVIIDGQGTRTYTLIVGRGISCPTYDIEFRRIPDLFSLVNTGNSSTNNLSYTRCKFTDCFIRASVQNPQSYFYYCQLINCSFNFVAGLNIFSYCVLINTNPNPLQSPASTSYILNCYIKGGYCSLSTGVLAANFNYNCFDNSYIIMNFASSVTSGIIQDIFGRYYDLSIAGSGGNGTVGSPFQRSDTTTKPFDLTNHKIAYPTYNVNSFSTNDPKFNSIEDQDFTLQSNSVLIAKASDGISNIGGTNYAFRRTSRISFSGSQATVDPSLIFQYDNYIISGSEVTGSVTSAPIAVNTSVPKVIQKVTYNGLLAFNKDTGSASGSNQNVPDFDTFTSASGNAAANPDRLVYYMRHTTGSSIPISDAGWDNGGLWTAGQYNVFEWNTKPSIDNLGVGNGSGSFNAAVSPTFIQATYVQMQVKLRNDYLF